jgi:hypothetical protein
MKKFLIRKTWIVKAEDYKEACQIVETTNPDGIHFKILTDEKGGNKTDGKKIKIEKVKKKGFKRW